MLKVNKFCSCGKVIPANEKCRCKNRKSKKEKERNSDLTKTRWRKFRLKIIERDHCHCQRCLYKFGIYNNDYSDMQVHHVKPRIKYPELMYEATNCVTLCKQCNLELGIRDTLDFKFKPEELEYHPTL